MRSPPLTKANWRIFLGFVQVLVFAIASKAIGGVKEILIAARYGASATLDGYLFTYEWNFWFVSLIASVLIFALVPYIVQMRQKSAVLSTQFLSEAIFVATALGLAIGLTIWLFFPLLIHASWVGMNNQAQNAAVYANLWLPWLIVTSLVSGVFAAALISRERHWSNLVEGVPAIGICLVVGLWTTADARPLVWGTVIGFVGQMVIFGVLVRSYGDPVMPSLRFSASIWQECMRGLGILTIGQAILSVSVLIDTVLTVRLGEGVLAHYGYALRMKALILGVFAASFGRACLPVFSDLLTREGSQNARLIALRWSYAGLGLGVGIACVGALIAPTAVRLLFERGAFTSQDTLVVSRILQMLLLQSPFYLMWFVLQAWFTASKKYTLIMRACGIAVAVKLIAGIGLSGLLGVVGVALSTVAMYCAAVGYTWVRFTRGR